MSEIPSEAVPEPSARRTWLWVLFPLRLYNAGRYTDPERPTDESGYIFAFGSFDCAISIAVTVTADEVARRREPWRAETVPATAVRIASANAARIMLAHACSIVRHGDADSRQPRPPASR